MGRFAETPSEGHALSLGTRGSNLFWTCFIGNVITGVVWITMIRTILHAAFLVALLNPAWGKATTRLPVIRQPSTVFTVGPGTVVSVHLLDLPFIEPHWAVKYKIDGGELIEVWHPGKDIPVLGGVARLPISALQSMHGILTYSSHPEMIVNFQVVEQKVQGVFTSPAMFSWDVCNMSW
jgi:hypothetical protein